MAATHLIELAKHMEWADAVVWTSVLASDAVRGDQRIRGLLHHVHVVQHVFLHLWRGDPLRGTEQPDFPDAASTAAWGRDGHAGIQAFLAAADETLLARPLHVPWSAELERMLGRPIVPATIGQTALQLAVHSAHHRGQINIRLRESGIVPPLVDFIAWAWSGQPAAAWPIAAVGRTA